MAKRVGGGGGGFQVEGKEVGTERMSSFSSSVLMCVMGGGWSCGR